MSDPTEELWTYTGVRVATGNKRATSWHTPDGERLYLEKLSFITGGIYKVTVTKDGEHCYRDHPRYVKRVPPHHPGLAEWETAELEAEQHLEREARARAAKKNPHAALEEVMKPLLRYARSCRSRGAKDALVAEIIRRVTVAWATGQFDTGDR